MPKRVLYGRISVKRYEKNFPDSSHEYNQTVIQFAIDNNLIQTFSDRFLLVDTLPQMLLT